MSAIQPPTAGRGQSQPWKKWWPPSDDTIKSMSEEELKSKPWVNWKPDVQDPNAKPWLQWVPRDAHIIEHLQSTSSSGSGPAPEPEPEKPLPVIVPPSSNAEGG
ncbi:hypothetical protein QBC36DRAFT_308708 [Triangularia setosa]|uniref:Uncharacterized protein n=1 Tax=Triangularia setosa TaxID=2587417 RepID=A0AAN6WBG6_9PEZI|nr:hypothetical protein QBC36DRAFT_308708 [Podospora setosa]